jgi:formylglycine-generating enzyme required for sulfatase activity
VGFIRTLFGSKSASSETFHAGGHEWQREPAPSGMTWEEAKTYAASLRLAGGGWRLPSKEELLALYAARATEQLTGVPGMASGIYWSSATYQFNTDDAMVVDFRDGHETWKTKWQNQMRTRDGLYGMCVRCVR